MNRRKAKKAERKDCCKHGYYAWERKISREANELDALCFLRNNSRKWHGEPMFGKHRKRSNSCVESQD